MIKLHSNFSFCYLENMVKDRLSKTSGCQFHKLLLAPEKLSGLSRNGPQRSERDLNPGQPRANPTPELLDHAAFLCLGIRKTLNNSDHNQVF